MKYIISKEIKILVANFDRSKEMITTRLVFHNQQVFSLKNKYKGKHFS